MGVVVVVPTLTKGKEGNPPAVGRFIFCFVGTVAKLVGCAVHQPGAVVEEDEAEEDAPNDEGQAVVYQKVTGNVEHEAQDKLQMDKVLIKKAVDGIRCNITGEAG